MLRVYDLRPKIPFLYACQIIYDTPGSARRCWSSSAGIQGGFKAAFAYYLCACTPEPAKGHTHLPCSLILMYRPPILHSGQKEHRSVCDKVQVYQFKSRSRMCALSLSRCVNHCASCVKPASLSSSRVRQALESARMSG